METIRDELETQMAEQEWKKKFCDHFENTLENAEGVADCIIEGTYMEDDEICHLCNILVATVNVPDEFESICEYFIMLLGPSRNVTSFFCKWNVEFVVVALNYILVKRDFPEISAFLKSLPNSSKVVDKMNDSEIFKNILLRFIDCDNIGRFLMYCTAIIRMAVGKDFIFEEERALLVRAKQKLKNMSKAYDAKDDEWIIEATKDLLYAFDTPKIITKNYKKDKTETQEVLRQDFRNRSPAKCCNTNCSKLSKSKAKYCARCLFPCYCSQKCQKEHWKIHKKECRVLTTIGNNLVPLLDDF